MPHIGVWELLVILLIVVVLFGASRLPQIGRGLGEGIRNFRRGVKDSGSREQLDEGDEVKDRAAS
jgi:sec-independent protein translocase protein TatA